MPLVRTAALLGVVMGVYSIAAGYLVITFLPLEFADQTNERMVGMRS